MTETPKQAARRLAAGQIKLGYRPQALHEYTDSSGNPLFWVIRLKNSENGKKWIRPMHLNGQDFALGEPAFPENGRPLYRLPDLAARPEDPVFLVEGERCADSLAEIELLATTSGSAESAATADFGPLAGRRVIIWRDNDAAGKRYADIAEQRLKELKCDVHQIDVERLNLQPKADVVDWLRAHRGATAANVLSLVRDGVEPEAGEPSAHPDLEGSKPKAPETDEEALSHLASLGPVAYERIREGAAKRLGIRVSTLDKEVQARRGGQEADGFSEQDVTPWPQSVEPAELLTEIAGQVRRFIVCREETVQAATLWATMTWFMDAIQVAPLAVITAPEKRCGKTQLLSLLGRLVRRPIPASNITPAALFRSIDAWQPTLLIDEADAFIRENEELRGLLNAGHTRDSAFVVRVVGEAHTPYKFNVWGAKALAGIGRLSDTLMDRAVTLPLRRKLPDEKVERLRHAAPELFKSLRAKLARFSLDYSETVRAARPELPAGLNDRAQDNWEPLLAIAHVAGGQWPTWARAAALNLSGEDSTERAVGSELLSDIQEVFDLKDIDKISTADLIKALCEDEERPWATYNRGKPIAPRQVATRLKEYGIRSKTIRIGYSTPKGYEVEQFIEAFSRYLGVPGCASQDSNTQPSSDGKDLPVADRLAVAATLDRSATAELA